MEHNSKAAFNLGGYIFKDKLWFFGSFMPSYYKRDRAVDFGIQGRNLVKDFTRTENQFNGMFKLTSQPLKNLRVSAGFINNFWKYLGDSPEANSATTSSPVQRRLDLPEHVGQRHDRLERGQQLHDERARRLVQDRPDQFGPAYRHDHSPLPLHGRPALRLHRVEQPDVARDPRRAAPLGQLVEQVGRRARRHAEDAARAHQRQLGRHLLHAAGRRTFVEGRLPVHPPGPERQLHHLDRTDRHVRLEHDLVQSGVNYGRGKYGWYSVRNNDKTGPYGDVYNVYANNYALYLQDSWTIGTKLTVNFGVRAENEYLPGYTPDPAYPKKAIEFPWSKKLAPRFGFTYDVYGDSSLKVFGSFGIFQDMMKLDMAANAFGGFKWKSAYYYLEDYDFTKIGVGGNYPGKFLYTYDYRPPSFDLVDPDIKPFSQREISLGLEKKLAENVSASVRLVSKSVLNAIEDSAIYTQNAAGNWEEHYYQSNPGSDFLKNAYDKAIAAGQLAKGTPYIPNAKREYLGINLALEKRFSNNWMGGVSYTLSRLSGNYSGLFSSDEVRNSPNGERIFDLWYLSYDKNLNELTGPLPTDRPHVFKAYGSYAFPFGLTLGGVFNAMSGTPITEEWILDSAGYYPFNRGSMGRTPFLTFANIYAEYNFKIGRTTLQVNANIDNAFDTKTARRKYNVKYLDNVGPQTDDPDDTLFLQRTLISKNWTPNSDPSYLDPLFGKEYSILPAAAGSDRPEVHVLIS